MHARCKRKKRHPHRLARSRSQRPVSKRQAVTKSEERKREQRNTPYTHAALQRQDPRSHAWPSHTITMRIALPPPPTLPNAHFKSPSPHTLIKHKHIQRKLIVRHQSARTHIGTRRACRRSRRYARAPGLADADAYGACASDGDGADEGKDVTRARDNSAADGVPRGGSAPVLGTLAAPHAASGPCRRGVVGTDEPLGYAGYAGVAGGGVVPPRLHRRSRTPRLPRPWAAFCSVMQAAGYRALRGPVCRLLCAARRCDAWWHVCKFGERARARRRAAAGYGAYSFEPLLSVWHTRRNIHFTSRL